MSLSSPSDETTMYRRPVELLQQLIRFDTTNPPGNEAACIGYISALLRAQGIEPLLVARDPARPNLVARIAGEAPRRPCCCMAMSTSSRPPSKPGSIHPLPAWWPAAMCGDAARWT